MKEMTRQLALQSLTGLSYLLQSLALSEKRRKSRQCKTDSVKKKKASGYGDNK